MTEYNFKNKVTTSPNDVQVNDVFAIKVVAIASYDNDWSAYMGPSDWSDMRIIASGDKLLKEQAEPLFYVLRASGRHYRP